MNGGGTSSIVSSAEALRVQVFDGSVACPAESGTPLVDKTFAKGATISVDVKPGNRTIVLTAYSDAAATMMIGRACTTQTLGKGDKICLDITVDPLGDLAGADLITIDQQIPDGGVEDQAMPDQSLPDDMTVLPDLIVLPDLAPECTDKVQCGTGKLCCDQKCIPEDVNNCGECKNTCNSTHGTPSCQAGVCAIECDKNFGNCDGNANLNGCEVDLLTSAANCGACNRGCSTDHTSTDRLTCAAGICTSTCADNFQNCSQPPAPTADNGCECEGNACCSTGCQVKHNTGIGNSGAGWPFYDCVELNKYNETQATAACQAQAAAGMLATFTCAKRSFDTGGSSAVDVDAICLVGFGGCTCWVYAAPNANAAGRVGHVRFTGGGDSGNNCASASSTDALWH